ncbi:hypothetical protein AKJ16_DCAP04421, partial [Drosera capensis]
MATDGDKGVIQGVIEIRRGRRRDMSPSRNSQEGSTTTRERFESELMDALNFEQSTPGMLHPGVLQQDFQRRDHLHRRDAAAPQSPQRRVVVQKALDSLVKPELVLARVGFSKNYWVAEPRPNTVPLGKKSPVVSRYYFDFEAGFKNFAFDGQFVRKLDHITSFDLKELSSIFKEDLEFPFGQ